MATTNDITAAAGAAASASGPRVLDRTCKIPLWTQLRDDVARRIVAGDFTAKQRITCYKADPRALATIITNMTDPDFYEAATEKASRLRERLSWKELKPRYQEVFSC